MIEVINVTCDYGATRAVAGVGFHIHRGDVVAYVGANGSGKSTTAKVLAGLSRPTSGLVRLDGSDVWDDISAYRAIVGYVPEEARVYSFLSAEEYLLLAGRLRALPEKILTARMNGLLETLGLGAVRHARLSTLSKGLKQRALLAGALIHNPAVVILDEPESGLDLATNLALRAIIAELGREGRMVFYSTHDLDAVDQLSTRVIVLREGRKVAEGTVEELRKATSQLSLEHALSTLAVGEDLQIVARRVLAIVTQ